MTHSGWRHESLGRLGELIKARGGTKKDQTPNGVPVIRYGELYTRHHEVIRRFHSFIPMEKASAYTPLRIGDILFAGSGETIEDIGKAAAFLGPEPAYGSGDLIVFRPGHGLDPCFLGYCVNGPDANAQKRRLGQGSSVFHIHSDRLETIKIAVPPLGEQRKIAAILSTVDEAIEATKTAIAQLHIVKKAMMAELLSRGLPGRHARFKQTEIGEVPEPWLVRTLAVVGDPERPISYGVLKPGPFTADGIPMLRITDIKGGRVSKSEWHLISDELSRQYGRTVLHGGETLISLVGTLGLVAHVRSDLRGANVHRNLGVVVPGKEIEPEFLTLALSGPAFQAQIVATTKGGNQPLLNLGDLRECKVPVPSQEEQRAIKATLNALSDRIDTEIAVLRQVVTVKSALMSVLLTGEVRVQPDEEAA